MVYLMTGLSRELRISDSLVRLAERRAAGSGERGLDRAAGQLVRGVLIAVRMRADSILIAPAIGIVAALVAGCGGTPAEVYSCDSPVTFKLVQSQVFEGCGPNCHQMSPPAGGLDLSSGMAHADLVHARSTSSPSRFLVEPRDPDHSFLWRKLRNQLAANGSEGVAMPRSANDTWAPLSQEKLTTVYCWINEGAKND